MVLAGGSQTPVSGGTAAAAAVGVEPGLLVTEVCMCLHWKWGSSD